MNGQFIKVKITVYISVYENDISSRQTHHNYKRVTQDLIVYEYLTRTGERE